MNFGIEEYFDRRRHRRLLKHFSLPANSRILDISCGDGDLLHLFHRHFPQANFFGVDMSEKAVQKAALDHPWGSFAVARAEALPYAPQTFDVMLCCMSLHHYAEPHAVFAEMSRVLAPDGAVHIVDMVPRYRVTQWLENLYGCPEPYHFEKYYKKEEIESLASEAGLCVVSAAKLRALSPLSVLTIKHRGK